MQSDWCVCGAGDGSAPAASMIEPPSLAMRLRDLRLHSRRSAADVARTAGISRQQLWRSEQGLVPNPSPDILVRLASAYGLGLPQLLGRAPPAERERTLLRLMRSADALSEEEWQLLDDLAKRAWRNAHRAAPSDREQASAA